MKQFKILQNVIYKQKHFPKIKLLTKDFINYKKELLLKKVKHDTSTNVPKKNSPK